jgi:hypothetical protein
MTADPDLVLWERKEFPGTVQVLTDVNEDTGGLIVEIWGEAPAPPPPSDVLNGSVIAGRVTFRANEKRCLLFDVKLEPM